MSVSTKCDVCKKDYCANLYKIQEGIHACEGCYSSYLQKQQFTRMVTKKENE